MAFLKISSCGDFSEQDKNAPSHKRNSDRFDSMDIKNQAKQNDSVQPKTSESALKFTLQLMGADEEYRFNTDIEDKVKNRCIQKYMCIHIIYI